MRMMTHQEALAPEALSTTGFATLATKAWYPVASVLRVSLDEVRHHVKLV